MNIRLLIIITSILSAAITTAVHAVEPQTQTPAANHQSIHLIATDHNQRVTTFMDEVCASITDVSCIRTTDATPENLAQSLLMQETQRPRTLETQFPTRQSQNDSTHRDTIYVTVGKSALKMLINTGIQNPIIATFVSRVPFQQTVKQYNANGLSSETGTSIRSVKPHNTTAIYADPSPLLQLSLAQALLGENKPLSVGTILSPKSLFLKKELNDLANSLGIDLRIETISENTDLFQSLSKMDKPNKVDALLLIPDRNLYDSRAIVHLLNAKYRSRQPVIGFSPSVTKAGALATTFHTAIDFAQVTVEMIESYQQSKQLPTPRYATKFEIETNHDIAQSLNINLPNSAGLKQRLLKSAGKKRL